MSAKKNEIVFLVPYLGEWPKWFDTYLIACETNRDITWKIFTDCEIPHSHPPNVHFFRLTMPQFNALASRKLGFPVQIKRPYKLCDLRPAFGRIFGEHIPGFEFWGHCDIDIIWGDIRNFVSEDILQQYDIISAFNGRIYGPCTLFRNTPLVNDLYKEVPGHRFAFTRPGQLHFDELHMSAYVLWGKAGVRILWLKLVYAHLIMLKFSMNLYKGPVFRNGTLPAGAIDLFLTGGLVGGWVRILKMLRKKRVLKKPNIRFYADQFSVDPLVLEHNRENWFWEDGKVFGPRGLRLDDPSLAVFERDRIDKLLPFSKGTERMLFDFGGFAQELSRDLDWSYSDRPRSFNLKLDGFTRRT